MSEIDYKKALIIQKLFNLKSIYKYRVYRQSGKISIVDNLFCLRKRNPENIIKIEKFLYTVQVGNIKNKDIIEKLKLESDIYFNGFDKNDNLEFKVDEGNGWYSIKIVKKELINK